MKQKSFLAFVVALTVASPVLGQDAVPSTPSGQIERKEPGKPAEEQPDQPTDEGGKQGSKAGKKESKKALEDDWGFRWTNHPSLRLGPGTRVDFRVRLQGNLQDWDAELPDDQSSSSIDVARRRIGIDGEIFNIFDYQVEGELGAKQDPWRDVYLNYKQYDFAQVQFGKFKMPFSLDENTSVTNLDFVYRSRIAALLAPGRDRGVMVHGRVLRRGWQQRAHVRHRARPRRAHRGRPRAGAAVQIHDVARERSGHGCVVHAERPARGCHRPARTDRARGLLLSPRDPGQRSAAAHRP
jgi:hypothetical protein